MAAKWGADFAFLDYAYLMGSFDTHTSMTKLMKTGVPIGSSSESPSSESPVGSNLVNHGSRYATV